MRLAEYTDYTLRVLMYCAAHPDGLVTIKEIAESHSISKNHLMKIVNDLARQGVLATTRGRGGGVRLLKRASDIRIGEIVRMSESDFRMVECFDDATNSCALSETCRLRGLLDRALLAYFKELDGVTLEEIAKPLRPGGATAMPRGKPVRVPVKPAAPAGRGDARRVA